MLERIFSWRPVVNQNIPSLDLRAVTVPEPAINVDTGGSNVLSGCGFFGRINPILGTHLYTVSVRVNGCDSGVSEVETIPTYTGLVSLRGTDRLVLGLSNGEYDFSGEYTECLTLFCTP